MRILIFFTLLLVATSVSAAGGGGGGVGGGGTTTSSTLGAGGYGDSKDIVRYPLQQGLMLFRISTFKYGW